MSTPSRDGSSSAAAGVRAGAVPVPRWKTEGIHWGDDNEQDDDGNPDTRYCVTLQHTEVRAEVVGQLVGWSQFPSDRERYSIDKYSYSSIDVAGAEDGVHIQWERARFEQHEQGGAAGAQGDAGAAPAV